MLAVCSWACVCLFLSERLERNERHHVLQHLSCKEKNPAVSKDFPAFSTLSLFSEVIVGLGIFTSNEIGSTRVREKLDRKGITLVVLGGGECKKMMAGCITIP